MAVWRSGTFILYSCEVGFRTQEMSPRLPDVNRLVTAESVVAIGSVLTYLQFSGSVPLLHMSTKHPGSLHMISFARPFPALVLQVTNTGVRRPGYKTILGFLGVSNPTMYLCAHAGSTASEHPSNTPMPK